MLHSAFRRTYDRRGKGESEMFRFVMVCMALAAPLTAVAAADRHITDGDRIGCHSRETYEKLTTFIAQGDKDAFKQLLVVSVASGDCTVFDAGEPVFIDDTALLSGMVKVRRKDEIDGYWTAIESTSK